MSEVKISNDEIVKLQEIRKEYYGVILNLGRNQVELNNAERNISNLKNQRDDLIKKLDSIVEIENRLILDIQNKYGKGNLDIDSGILKRDI